MHFFETSKLLNSKGVIIFIQSSKATRFVVNPIIYAVLDTYFLFRFLNIFKL